MNYNYDDRWEIAKTFRELQALNLMFIHGLFESSPNHLGPLCEESLIIAKELDQLNRLDVITHESEPYLVRIEDDIGIRQRPYINFVYPTRKVNELVGLVLARNSNLVIMKYTYKTGELFIHNQTDIPIDQNRFPLQQKLIDDEWVESYNTSHPFDLEYYPDTLGENFMPLLDQELTDLFITDPEFNNSMFTILVESAHQLFFH